MRWQRQVEPELLDELPVTDPEARHSRRDLQRINRLMRNDVHMARGLQHLAQDRVPRVIVDLGAGDGRFMLRVAQCLAPRWRNVHIRLLDRQNSIEPEVLTAFRDLGWQAESLCIDIFSWARQDKTSVDIVTANLFLHHFSDVQLQTLCADLAERAWAVIATEPRRNRLAWSASHLLGLLGCNRVTRHDATVSVRAGFTDTELQALWPQGGWSMRETWLAPFTHALLARRLE
jgi:hypothetical protein